MTLVVSYCNAPCYTIRTWSFIALDYKQPVFFAKGYLDDVLSRRERKRAVWPWPSREEGKTMSRPIPR